MPRTLSTLVAVLSLFAAPAFAGTAKENFAKRANKYAPAFSTPYPGPKTLCVCQDAGLEGQVGQLVQSFFPLGLGGEAVWLYCGVKAFDTGTGEEVGGADCTRWVPLAK